jgi:probable F420-dependent oxidoreductase
MHFDTTLQPTSLNRVPEIARTAERIGFDAIWTTETQHDPFLPCPLIAEHTQRLHFGTAIAVSFARSPANLAYNAWDLAQASQGRFILGLGTQVKAHIERRFGMPWPDSAVGKLREQIAAIRAFWNAWQSGEKLNFREKYYKLTLMSPFFNPGPIQHPNIPIYIAGVNTGLARLAGETADGFIAHPFHSPRYLREVMLPAIQKGAAKSGRNHSDIKMMITAFIATTPEERQYVRHQIGFYASTPTYRRVMALHGWEEVAQKLSGLARRGQWGELSAQISDEILGTFALLGNPADLPDLLVERYHDLADRLGLYLPFIPGERDDFWKMVIKQVAKSK